MDKARFLNMVRSLYNIDSFRLPELSREDWEKFVDNPPRYFIQADATQQAAIFREVEHRQVWKPRVRIKVQSSRSYKSGEY